MKYYLEFLVAKELLRAVAEKETPDPGLFKVTDKGRNFLRSYKGLKALMK